MPSIIISTNKELLDVKFINDFISTSHWAKGRSLETMQTCIDNSLNFGVYLDGKQIGYARLVTDYCIFAYLMDVFIDEKHRGKGYSKQLMQYMMEHESVKDVKVWRLATTDAHGLYAQFGFTPLSHPEKIMELMK
jgi:N-acetylglutamate synthase-like GNAT family acetyltransferase